MPRGPRPPHSPGIICPEDAALGEQALGPSELRALRDVVRDALREELLRPLDSLLPQPPAPAGAGSKVEPLVSVKQLVAAGMRAQADATVRSGPAHTSDHGVDLAYGAAVHEEEQPKVQEPVEEPGVDLAPRATEDLAGALAGLRQELRRGLARLEDQQAHLFDPADEHSALRRGISAELHAAFPRGSSDAEFGASAPESLRGINPGTGAAQCSRNLSLGTGAAQCSRRVSHGTGSNASTESADQELPPSSPSDHRSHRHQASLRLGVANFDVAKASGIVSSGVVSKVRQLSWYLVVRNELYFELAMGVAIVANTIAIGLEMQLDLDGKDISKIGVMEHVFLVVFMLEILIRICARGRDVWKSPWFRFDVFIVVVGIISSWVLEPVVKMWKPDGDIGTMLETGGGMLILRVLRILRLTRALRLFELFQELWQLANGLMHSIRTVLSAFALIVVTIYIFACIGIVAITTNKFLLDDPEANEVIQSYFASLPATMLTLYQWTNGDSISSVYMPLVHRSWPLVIYFCALWLIVTVCLMNMVTAVIVDKAIAQGALDREMQTHALQKKMNQYAPILRGLFQDIDISNHGEVPLKNIRAGLEKIDDQRCIDLPDDLLKILASDQLLPWFEFLDSDESGTINEEEFVEGISSLLSKEFLHAVPMEITQALHLLQMQGTTLDLIRDMSLQRERLRLASDHQSGVDRLNLCLIPRFQIGRGDGAERASVRPRFFNINLDQPLAQAHPMHSRVAVESPAARPA